jgi:hypothetical protein
MVPAGKCNWEAAVVVPNSKQITLQGAGMDATVITRGTKHPLFRLNQSGARVTGFGLINGHVLVDGDDWRIDNNRFSSHLPGFTEGVNVLGNREGKSPRGLIDHNFFYGTRIIVVGWTGLSTHALWEQPLDLGGPQAVFVEDNTFVQTADPPQVIDTNYGGRYVFRYNAVTNGYLEVHSLQHGRGSRSWEIYNNDLMYTREVWTAMFIRGGTGVVYNNTMSVTDSGRLGEPNITIDNVRSFRAGYDYGLCNGQSTADGNEETNGWPCRDQIGRGGDTSRSRPSNASALAGGWSSQISDPAYFWNNTYRGSPIGVYVHNGTGPWIQAGRDYVLNAGQKPGYSPYPYPHPLQARGIQ